MTILFVILVIIAAVILGLIVLIQNPKGGGLSGNFAGVSSQFMGVKQTNDILEKGTWLFAGIVAVLCLLSTFFISGSKAGNNGLLQDVNTTAPVQQTAPAPQQAAPGATQGTPATTPAK